MYHRQLEALGSTSETEWQLLKVWLLEGVMPLSYTEVADEEGHPYTK
jgi:hypothetical protein